MLAFTRAPRRVLLVACLDGFRPQRSRSESSVFRPLRRPPMFQRCLIGGLHSQTCGIEMDDRRRRAPDEGVQALSAAACHRHPGCPCSSRSRWAMWEGWVLPSHQLATGMLTERYLSIVLVARQRPRRGCPHTYLAHSARPWAADSRVHAAFVASWGGGLRVG